MNVEYTVAIDAKPEKVWAILYDVERWPEWTQSMSKVEVLDQPLAVGSRVKIKQPKLMAATMTVFSLEEDRSFSWRAKSPGLHTEAHHDISSSESGTSVTLRFELTGAFAGVAGVFWGSMIRRYVEMEGNGLKARAEAPQLGVR
ncbi:MAG TPA: SRPBCC family protein [Acidimicrobiia bacterium]|nr:SRPBCC family protein [Acidimicrobiia bacterium]